MPSSAQISCARYGANGVEIVRQFHHGGDGRVEVPAGIEVLGYLLQYLVRFAENFRVGSTVAAGRAYIACRVTVDAAEETINAFHSGIDPIDILLRWRGEQGEKAGGIGTVLIGNIIGGNHVADRL